MLAKKISALALAAAATFALSAAPTPAAAQLAGSPAALGVATADNGGVTQVQWRHGGGRYYGRGGYRGGGRYYGRGRGIGPAGIIGGLAAGAIIGGAIAAQQQPVYGQPVYGGGDAVGYCAQQYRSYDPENGTYLGYDGLRHPCP